MKVLYVGYIWENSGWGEVTRNHIKALQAVGVEVVPRPVVVTNRHPHQDPLIMELMAQSEEGCTHCIQHLFPHDMTYCSRFEKCVGLYEAESTHKYNDWSSYLNMMDEIWVPNHEMKAQAKYNRITRTTVVVPHAFDLSKYEVEYSTVNFPIVSNSYKFYFIGELNHRKNISCLLRAFHTHFLPSENVELVLKLNIPGKDSAETVSIFNEGAAALKESLHLNKDFRELHEEVLITDFIDEEDIMRIHQTCDCFVTPSHGEAWCIPAFEAACMGNQVISAAHGGPQDFLEDHLLLNSVRKTNIIGLVDSIDRVGFAREYWTDINPSDLGEAMRKAFEEGKVKKDVDMGEFSLESVGTKMKEQLLA